jgi:hypothetical protein
VRRVFRKEKRDVIGGYSRYHNEELHNLYYPQNIITLMKSTMVKWAVMRNAYKVFVRKPEGQRVVERCRYG